MNGKKEVAIVGTTYNFIQITVTKLHNQRNDSKMNVFPEPMDGMT